MKRLLLLLVLVSGIGIALPVRAVASNTIAGRISAYSAMSLSVLDKEVLTVTLDDRTTYTTLITQTPWEEDTRLNATALRAGRLVAVHVRRDDPNVADWVQVATDVRPVMVSATPTLPAATPARAVAAPSTSTDLLTSKEVRSLIANARTPADHVKLQKHYAALAAKYDADANEHAADAQAYRKNPTFSESKNPSGPGTVAHCERFAELMRQAAKEARDLAASHEHMAATK